MSNPLNEALIRCREVLARRSRGPSPKIDWEQVLRTFFSCGNQHTTATQLGLRQGRVSTILRRCGVHVGRGKRDPVHRLPMEEVARRYQAGESCGQLGEAFEVDPEVIRRRLRTFGQARRKASGAKGSRNSQWKGGHRPTMHYHRRQAYEVAAICLGQPLPRGWIIHHADENPKNNDPANLLIFQSQGEHAGFHQRLLERQQTENEVDAIQLALESGAQALPQPPRPIVLPPDTDQPAPSKKQRKPIWAHRKNARKRASSDPQSELFR